jgi:hypothetical protein
VDANGFLLLLHRRGKPMTRFLVSSLVFLLAVLPVTSQAQVDDDDSSLGLNLPKRKRMTERNMVNDVFPRTTLDPTLSVHSVGTSRILKPARFKV